MRDSPIGRQVALERVRQGHCPFCLRSHTKAGRPFLNLGCHIWRKHHITSNAFKAQVGLFFTTPICSPEFSARCRERPNREFLPEERARGRGVPRNVSPAGREVLRANGIKNLAAVKRHVGGSAKKGKHYKPLRHGSLYAYRKRGCRCDRCVARYRAASRRDNAALRNRRRAPLVGRATLIRCKGCANTFKVPVLKIGRPKLFCSIHCRDVHHGRQRMQRESSAPEVRS